MGNFKGGFGGGGFGGANMQQLMKQAQKMQEDMKKAQDELAETEITASASGMVEVKMTGDRTITSVKIKPEAVDPADVEMLEDLITAAFNDALKQVQELSEKAMGPLSGAGGLF